MAQQSLPTVGRRRILLGASAASASLATDLLVANESVAIAAESGANPVFDALLDRYLAAVNAHDTSKFPELFSESYIQHSGRSPSGLQAQSPIIRGSSRTGRTFNPVSRIVFSATIASWRGQP